MSDSLNGIKTLWTNLSLNNRILFALLTVGTVVALGATWQWAQQARYTSLYTNLPPEEAGEIVDKLTAMGVDFRFSTGGTALMVPEGDAQEARVRLAAEGFPRGGAMGYEIFDQSNLGMTDFLQKVNFRRALEGEISKSIMSLSEVIAARVHIVIPEKRLFSKDQAAPTASVVLKLSRPLSTGQIAGIQHMIAASVEGLNPEQIALIDYRGKLLTSGVGGEDGARLSSTEHDLVKRVEQHLEEKAQSMLDRTLGPAKSVVRVTASLNFDRVESSAESFDPDRVAIRSEETTSAKPGAQGDGDNTSATVTNYEISKNVERIVSAYGTIKRLSVAVMLDGQYAVPEGSGSDAQPTYQPMGAEKLQQIGAIVKTAVGFDSLRSDHVEVLNLAFDTESLGDMQLGLDSVTDWSMYMDLGRNIFLGLLVLVALLKARKLFKKMGEAIRAASAPSGASEMSSLATAGAGSDGGGLAGGLTMTKAAQEQDTPAGAFGSQKTTTSELFARQAEGKADEVAKIIKTLMVE